MLIELGPGYQVTKKGRSGEEDGDGTNTTNMCWEEEGDPTYLNQTSMKRVCSWRDGRDLLLMSATVEVEKLVYDFNEVEPEKEPAWMQLGVYGEKHYKRRGMLRTILSKKWEEETDIDYEIFGVMMLKFVLECGRKLYVFFTTSVGDALMPMGWMDRLERGNSEGSRVEDLLEDLEEAGVEGSSDIWEG
jgi:hypothetical protein